MNLPAFVSGMFLYLWQCLQEVVKSCRVVNRIFTRTSLSPWNKTSGQSMLRFFPILSSMKRFLMYVNLSHQIKSQFKEYQSQATLWLSWCNVIRIRSSFICPANRDICGHRCLACRNTVFFTASGSELGAPNDVLSISKHFQSKF